MQSLLKCENISIFVVDLKGREMETEGDLHVLIHYPNVPTSQGWTKVKPEIQPRCS